MSTADIGKICSVLDKLTLDALTLMEQEIQTKLNIENTMCNGETHLAKTRFIMGQNSVSSLQLPGENSPEFNAIAKIYSNETDEMLKTDTMDLEFMKISIVKDDGDRIVDPLKWFGVLVPQDLWKAQTMFKEALQWIVRAANIQIHLIETCNKIEVLKEKKTELLNGK